MTCHAIGGAGGKVGPDLTSIGASAQIDYLIESLFYPNRKIKEGFHSVIVETKDGLEFSGVVARESSDELVLRDATDKETTIAKKDIEKRSTGNSLMPSGLIDTLSSAERIAPLPSVPTVAEGGLDAIPWNLIVWAVPGAVVGAQIGARLQGRVPERASNRFFALGTYPEVTQTEIRDGCPLDCGLCPDHKQHACLAVIEVNTGCNLDCPICFADSGTGPQEHGYSLSLEQVESMLDAFVRAEGEPEAVQLSGGEPSIHPQILEFIRLANEKGIGLVTLNTNGIRLAHDRRFVAELAAIEPKPRIYLQFDGLEERTHVALRGRDLRALKHQALERCAEAGLVVVLAAAVERAGEIFIWFIHNALVHYLSPRGLEQYSGGGWGTRDVCQGPVELLLAAEREVSSDRAEVLRVLDTLQDELKRRYRECERWRAGALRRIARERPFLVVTGNACNYAVRPTEEIFKTMVFHLPSPGLAEANHNRSP